MSGKPIVNATEPLPFRVTDDDAKRAVPKDPERCAAALGLLRVIPGVLSVRVQRSRTFVEFENRIERYETPEAIRTELVALDRGGKFQPDDYSLRPLPPSARPNGKRTGGKVSRGARDKGSKDRTPKKPRIPAHHLEDVRPPYR